MLAIRLQRRGRKGHAQFRVIVQDRRLSPKSGKLVANLGAYDPHTKETTLDKEQAEFYLKHGAQPSPRVIKLFMDQKVSLPKWASLDTSLEGKLKNPEKLRKNRPAEEAAPAPEADTPADSDDSEQQPDNAAADDTAAEQTADKQPDEPVKEDAKTPDEPETEDSADSNTEDKPKED